MSLGPPPYEGATCKCGHGNKPVAVHGPYRGLCELGKEIAVEARRAKRAAKAQSAPPSPEREPIEDDIRALRRKPKLSKTIVQLGKAAEKLEEAVDDRAAARTRARTALGEFNEALKVVTNAARVLIEQRVPDPRAAEE